MQLERAWNCCCAAGLPWALQAWAQAEVVQSFSQERSPAQVRAEAPASVWVGGTHTLFMHT